MSYCCPYLVDLDRWTLILENLSSVPLIFMRNVDKKDIGGQTL